MILLNVCISIKIVVVSVSGRYDCQLLVYYELHGDRLGAIAREKQIKGGGQEKRSLQ